MARQVFTVTDLGPGDGGKGGVVHKIASHKKAHTVVKVGGAQGCHGVRTSRGEVFNFSQLGCGTFEGAKTFISKNFVVDPGGLLVEANDLRYSHGIREVFELLILDADALCTTPFHGIASRLRELARKENQKGIVGLGIGEAYLDSELHPDLAIRVGDLLGSGLEEKLEAIRLLKLRELSDIIDRMSELWPGDIEMAREEIAFLQNPNAVRVVANKYREFARTVRIVDTDFLRKDILLRDGVVVFESSHGILTDRIHGFYPHTSKLRTLPELTTFNLLDECGYNGQVVKFGITRGYQIRHGAGPMVTHNPDLSELLLPGSSGEENRWRGKVRVGPLDFVSLRYALGIIDHLDAIAVTWFDQIGIFGQWQICDSYSANDPKGFLTEEKRDIKRVQLEGQAKLDYQTELTRFLFGCKPNVTHLALPENGSRQGMSGLCSEVFAEKLGVPVRMISFGPTEVEKILL